MDQINRRDHTIEGGNKRPSKKNPLPETLPERKVYDNIHGYIYFPREIWNFIDTPEFQRLRNIRQLGTLPYVFPGATHSRFQHCLGTGHLALTYVKILIQKHRQLYDLGDPEKTKANIEQAIFTCTLAGIMHDIGHGPYSHTFDGNLIGSLWTLPKPAKWTHELASLKIFDNLITANEIKMKDGYAQRVKQLIWGKEVPKQRERRPWQFELINNELTGIDVDKMDYFRRDSYYLGAKNIYIDFELLMRESKIFLHDGTYRICYPDKYFEKVIDIYHSRYKLYKNFYLNKVNLGIEAMICDILLGVESHPQFDLLKKCQAVINGQTDGYIELTDDIINRVQGLKPTKLKPTQDVIGSQKLLKRLRKRQIYRFVKSSQTFIGEDIKKGSQTDITIEKIFKKQRIIDELLKYGKSLKKEDIRVLTGDITFGMKDQNPTKLVKFFNKGATEQKVIQIPPQRFSMLDTRAFIEKYICVYVTDENEDKFDQVEAAFDKYIQQNKLYLYRGMQGKLTPRKTDFMQNWYGDDSYRGTLDSSVPTVNQQNPNESQGSN